MVLDKALLLKGLAGAASVGGVAVGGYYISGSGKSEKEQVKQFNTLVDVGQEDELGLPVGCEGAKSCYIGNGGIKKIKFQALGDGKEDEITVNPQSEINVTLTIDGENDSKKYIFENKGEEITIKRGEDDSKKVTLKGNGKTRFTVDDKKLKLLELGNYGLPSRCVTSNPCILTKDDLSLIKFSGFEDNGEATVKDFLSGQTITLTIEDIKYIFKNNNPINTIDIKKGGVTVTLDAEAESEFTLESGKLKKVELWDFGLPKTCELVESNDSQSCQLSENDLKKIKFKNIGNSPTISGLNNNEKITLEIKKIDDSSYPDSRKYTFTPNSSNNVKITNSSAPQQSITLTKGEGNEFKKDNLVLVAVPKKAKANFQTDEYDEKIKDLGLPNTCTFTLKASGDEKSIECELSLNELKALKFSVGDNATFSGGQEEENNFNLGNPKTYKLKIEETENEENFGSKNIRVTFLNRDNDAWNEKLTISSSSEGETPIIIYNNSNTEFKINSSNKLEKAWKIDNLPALVGLKCPKVDDSIGSECVLKENDGSIKVFVDDKEKDFKPADSSTIESNISFKEDEDGLSQGIEFKVSNSTITGTNKDKSSESLELVVGSYEIRRINGKGWRLAKKRIGF